MYSANSPMSSPRSRKRRQVDPHDVDAVVQILAEAGSGGSFRPGCGAVAATIRTSTSISSRPPTRRIFRSCSVRSSLACSSSGSSPSSSRKNVPPSANSTRPIRRLSAPVNAPFSWPKNSLSSKLSGIAPQSTGTNGPGRAAAAAVDAAGDQLLAGAGLAHHQHVDVGVGHLLDRVEHLAHGRAAADHVVEAVGPLDLAAQQFVLGLEPPPAQQPLGRLPQRCRLERLGQVIAGAATSQSGCGRSAGVRGRRAGHTIIGNSGSSSRICRSNSVSLAGSVIDVGDHQVERLAAQLLDAPLGAERRRRTSGDFERGQRRSILLGRGQHRRRRSECVPFFMTELDASSFSLAKTLARFNKYARERSA